MSYIILKLITWQRFIPTNLAVDRSTKRFGEFLNIAVNVLMRMYCLSFMYAIIRNTRRQVMVIPV